MQKSYSKNYLKIYFFQILSILLGFVSLFIVVPYLSADKTTYGIYTVCISVTVFLSYADLGFLGAGMKYAAECFSKNDRDGEMKIIGFSHFMLFSFLCLLSTFFLYLSNNPQLLINAIKPGKETEIAHNLLLILALFSPTIILQRILQMIFSIRLQDFILQQYSIIGNLIKIFSVFFFFGYGEYDIVNYFLFIQTITLIIGFLGILKAKSLFDYDFRTLLIYFKYTKKMYQKTKNLAFSGLVITVSWILYYELDTFVIARILGANEVAIYAIGFTLLSFFRSLLGVFFSPFSARFNHFIGSNQNKELKDFYLHIIIIAFPIVVFPIVSVVFFAKPLVISWVGIEYEKSVSIVTWLILCNILAFVSYPAGNIMVAQEKIKVMFFISIMMPIIYWGGIFFTINYFGLKTFSIFKFIAFLVSGLIYVRYSLIFLQISLLDFIKKVIIPYLPALLFLCIAACFSNNFFEKDNNKFDLLLNIMFIGTIILVSIFISMFTAIPLRLYTYKILLTLNIFKK